MVVQYTQYQNQYQHRHKLLLWYLVLEVSAKHNMGTPLDKIPAYLVVQHVIFNFLGSNHLLYHSSWSFKYLSII